MTTSGAWFSMRRRMSPKVARDRTGLRTALNGTGAAAIQELTAIRQSLADHAAARERIENKLDAVMERLVRLETRYENLRADVRNEIMADLKADLMKAQVYLDLQERGLLRHPASDRRK